MACDSEITSSAPWPPEVMILAARPPASQAAIAASRRPRKSGVTEPSFKMPQPKTMMYSVSGAFLDL